MPADPVTAPPPRRPWWKKKRWWLVITFWLSLPVAYLLSIGPAYYGISRGWLPYDETFAAYRPAWSLAYLHPTTASGLISYCRWWELHAASD